MQIRKIRFENIHSLKGEHEIDFGDGILAEAGLFAITGPTGSGKSTLLDVITLALYNRIARMDKGVTRTMLEDDGGIMTRNMKSCFAEVEYRVNGKDYRSSWSIARNRNNNLNTRKQELVEVATGTIIEEGTKTPEKNEAVIGLGYDQFIKAMVLSQGEFSKLLQAPRNERNKLLEDITGARSYREIGKAVFQRYCSFRDKVKMKEAGLETMEVLPPEIVQEKKEELKSLTSSKPTIEKEFQEASQKITTRKELLKKLEEQKVLESNQKILKEHFERFAGNKARLEQHEKLSKYNTVIVEYNSILKEVDTGKKKISVLTKQIQDAGSLQKEYLDLCSKLLGENLEISNVNEALGGFRKKITELQATENFRSKEALHFQNQIRAYGKNIVQLGDRKSVV